MTDAVRPGCRVQRPSPSCLCWSLFRVQRPRGPAVPPVHDPPRSTGSSWKISLYVAFHFQLKFDVFSFVNRAENKRNLFFTSFMETECLFNRCLRRWVRPPEGPLGSGLRGDESEPAVLAFVREPAQTTDFTTHHANTVMNKIQEMCDWTNHLITKN